MPKTKRVWTDEQRQAAAERMRRVQGERWAKKVIHQDESLAKGTQIRGEATASAVKDMGTVSTVTRDPEVQAVIDTMTPERKAKLAAIQSRQWQRDASEDKATREALERHEALKNGDTPLESPASVVEPTTVTPVEPPKPPVVLEVPFKVPFRLTGSQSGLMISELSPCICGEQRLKWHPVCLKVKVNG